MSGTQPNVGRDPVEQLAEEFADRLRRGERPTIDDYKQKHPQWAERIQQVFSALVVMERLKPKPDDDSSIQAEENPAAPQLRKPEQIGDYRILREVGRGGMGVVYEAEQTSLGRHVAIKVLQSSAVIDSNHVARFEREARAAARLHHTNIVPVFGVGREDNLHYYVMQFIPGQPLDDVLAELKWLRKERSSSQKMFRKDNSAGSGRTEEDESAAARIAVGLLSGEFSPETMLRQPSKPAAVTPRVLHEQSVRLSDSSAALPGETDVSSVTYSDAAYWQCIARLGIQVAEALEYAHGQGVLHRDIKPANLLLDHHGTVWVTDFGLARVGQEDGLTQTGDIVGTLRYMAPEAFHGKYEERSDIHGLGLTLYEMVALRPAFDAIDRSTLIRQVTSGEFLRLGKASRHVPRDLETIVMKALEHEPAHRYTTGRQMAEDLQRFLDDKPIRARRASSVERAWRWSRRNPAFAASLVVVAGLLLFLAVAGQLVAWNQTDLVIEAEAARSEAVNARERDRRHLYIARMMLAKQAWESGNVGRMRELLDYYVPAIGQEDLRGFEWRHLWRFCLRGAEAPTFENGGNQVAFSPDGKTLAICGFGVSNVNLWNVDTGEEVAKSSFSQLKGSVMSVAYSPDGQIMVTGGGGYTFGPTGKRFGELNLWDVGTGKLLHELSGHAAPILSVAFSHDGRMLASGSYDKTIKLWDVETAGLVRTLKGHSHRVEAVAFSRDGRTLASGGGETGEVMLWDVESGNNLEPLHDPDGHAASLAFSPNGRTLAVANGINVDLWNLDSRSIERTLQGHSMTVRSVAFSPDGRTLASGSEDRTTRIWDATTATLSDVIKAQSSGIAAVVFAPDGQTLASTSYDRTTKLWDLGRGQTPEVLHAHTDKLKTLAFSPDGRTLVSGGKDETIRVWDPDNGKQRVHFLRQESQVRLVAILQHANTLVSVGDDMIVKVWDLATGNPEREVPLEGGVTGYIYGGPPFAISGDGTILAAATRGGTVDLWGLTTGERLNCLQHGETNNICVSFSPDGAQLVSGSLDGTVKLWDADSGKLLHTFKVPSSSISGVAFSPDGTLLAAGERTTMLWDTATGELVHTLFGHGAPVNCLAFAPDGKTLATGSLGGILKLWDVATGEERFELARLRNQISAVAFSADGTTLAAATWDNGIWLYRAAARETVDRGVPGILSVRDDAQFE